MKISINKPCHENWDKMTPNDKGAFCLSCQKNVVDFSNKTITHIKDFFAKKTDSESVCGRFEEDQLTELSFDEFFNQFKKWKYFQKFALIAFFVFGFSLFGYGQTSQTNNHQQRLGMVVYHPQDTAKKHVVDTTHKSVIKGKVKLSNTNNQSKNKKPVSTLMGDVMYEEKAK